MTEPSKKARESIGSLIVGMYLSRSPEDRLLMAKCLAPDTPTDQTAQGEE